MALFCSVVAETAFISEELFAYDSILDVIEAYDEGKCDFALVPIENSTEGTVNMSIDKIFHDSKATVVAEFVLPISQNLLALSKRGKLNIFIPTLKRLHKHEIIYESIIHRQRLKLLILLQQQLNL